MAPANVVLGSIAGVTIFVGLLAARWRVVSERLRGLLVFASAGVLLFLVIEVGFQAMGVVEAGILSGGLAGGLVEGLILVAGFSVGLIGLAWLEERRVKKRIAGAGELEMATMIAIGIGLHNFAEGLAIGQSFASGATALGTVLVVGFALHNATEGFGIAGPLIGHAVSWKRLLWLGLIGGGPTALGAMIGGFWVHALVELLFLSLATGSLVYVLRELLRIRLRALSAVGVTSALAIGLFVAFGTELVVDVAQSGLARAGSSGPASVTMVFADNQVSPVSASLARGESIAIENGDAITLIFEGNGLFVGEVAVSPSSTVTVAATGREGEYRLVDERGLSAAATVIVTAGAPVEPLTDEVNVVGALTVLEGHVRAARDLHERGARGEGPHPELDLKRAGKHAGHPHHELLMGSEPDALRLQKFLREGGAFDELDQSLSAYVAIMGDASVPEQEVERKYQEALQATERARQAVAGDAYETPRFRARVLRFVMDTAASEYATATQGGRVAVEEPGVPGRDNFIEYQDARSFFQAAYDLLGPLGDGLSADSRDAFQTILSDIFGTIDPADPDRPVPHSVIRDLIERIERGLAG